MKSIWNLVQGSVPMQLDPCCAGVSVRNPTTQAQTITLTQGNGTNLYSYSLSPNEARTIPGEWRQIASTGSAEFLQWETPPQMRQEVGEAWLETTIQPGDTLTQTSPWGGTINLENNSTAIVALRIQNGFAGSISGNFAGDTSASISIGRDFVGDVTFTESNGPQVQIGNQCRTGLAVYASEYPAFIIDDGDDSTIAEGGDASQTVLVVGRGCKSDITNDGAMYLVVGDTNKQLINVASESSLLGRVGVGDGDIYVMGDGDYTTIDMENPISNTYDYYLQGATVINPADGPGLTGLGNESEPYTGKVDGARAENAESYTIDGTTFSGSYFAATKSATRRWIYIGNSTTESLTITLTSNSTPGAMPNTFSRTDGIAAQTVGPGAMAVVDSDSVTGMLDTDGFGVEMTFAATTTGTVWIASDSQYE